MSSNLHNPPEDVLAQATAVLREAPLPDGPPEALVASTLASLQEAGRSVPTPAFKRRIFTMRAISKLAAAAVLAVALGGLMVWLTAGTSIAFADVIERIRDVRAVSYKTTSVVNVAGQPPQTQVFEGLIIEPARMRQSLPGGAVAIFDWKEAKVLSLDPTRKQAVLLEMTNLPAGQMPPNILEALKRQEGKAGKAMGRKAIAGRQAEGFQVVTPGQELTIWADVETRLPVQAEITMQAGLLPRSSMTMTDFVWDPPVDESLVSLEPPPGYELRTLKMDMGPATEKDVLAGLQAAAEINGGEFPSNLSMEALSGILGTLAGATAEERATPNWKAKEAQFQQAIMTIGRAWMFIDEPRNGSEWHYAGKGVRFGEANRAIFWYLPKDSAVYRVIDADLTIREVGPDRLPDVPAVRLGAEATTQPAGR